MNNDGRIFGLFCSHDPNPIKIHRESFKNSSLVECGRLWLESAKVARKSGYLQSSFSSLLQATELMEPFVQIERSKWFWEQGLRHKAIEVLQAMDTSLPEEIPVQFRNSDPFVLQRLDKMKPKVKSTFFL